MVKVETVLVNFFLMKAGIREEAEGKTRGAMLEVGLWAELNKLRPTWIPRGHARRVCSGFYTRCVSSGFNSTRTSSLVPRGEII